MTLGQRLLEFAAHVGEQFKALNHRVSVLESQMTQLMDQSALQLQTSSLQSMFPTLPTEQITTIFNAVKYADQHSELSASAILGLLGRPGNVIWDLQHKWGLYQDVGGQSPVTNDNQPIRRVTPWAGGNSLVLDDTLNPLTSSQSEGALFPPSGAVARFTKRSDLKFMLAVVTPDLTGRPNGFCWLLGEKNRYDLHPAIGDDKLFSLPYAPTFANGSIWINGTPGTNNQKWPEIPSLITLQPTEAFSADSIAEDRVYAVQLQRTFYGRHRLMLISSEVFTIHEIDALNQFALSYSGLAGVNG